MMSIKKRHRLWANHFAVSPVIGELLMVAIVVILGAIIAAYAFGLGNNVEETYTVAVIAEQNEDDTIIVTFHGGQDADKVLFLNVSVNGVYSNGSIGWDTTPLNTFDGDGSNPIETGSSRYIKNDPPGEIHITSELDHVIVVGKFINGDEQLILDSYV